METLCLFNNQVTFCCYKEGPFYTPVVKGQRSYCYPFTL